jgi:hypothetical protein
MRTSTRKFFIVFFLHPLLTMCNEMFQSHKDSHILSLKFFLSKIPSNLGISVPTHKIHPFLCPFFYYVFLSSFLFVGSVYLWVIETIEINTLTYFGLVPHFEKNSSNVSFRLYVSVTFFFQIWTHRFLILTNVRNLLCVCNMNLFIT